MSSATAVESPEPSLNATMAGVSSWIRRDPLGALLLALSAGVLLYFYGFYSVFMNGAQSTAVWAWKGWNEENDQVHCRFILPIILFILWQRRGELISIVKAPSARGLGLRHQRCRFIRRSRALFAAPLRDCLSPARRLRERGIPRRQSVCPRLHLSLPAHAFHDPIGGIIQGTVTLQLLASKTVGALCALLGIHVQIIGTHDQCGRSFLRGGGRMQRHSVPSWP